MKSDRARRVEELFRAAVELSPAQRRALLDARVADQPDLRAEVESLLAHNDQDEDFLGAPPREIEELGELAAARLPARIGGYRILSELGRGGMGIVYLAEQDRPRRQVALKVIRPSLVSPRSLRRFEREAELLARVQHPSIAQVYEAGTADAGDGPQAFLAMELVKGRTLSAYVAAHRLGTRERLALLVQACDAVDHAHRSGVIHRDLKPGNLLVDEASESPRVKVLDFGVARATDAAAVSRSLRTDVGQIVGTLPYMSPEQALGDEELVDPRSDVYALGVIGYELACDRLPIDVIGKPLHEALRIVREHDPTPISRFAPVLRGDVETILGKALEKEPRRRYASAAELAADLRRYFDDRPILARPPSRAYVVAKFARRNRALVGGVAAAFLALTLGLATTTWQAVAAADARDRANDAAEEIKRESLRAEREMRRASAIARFQREMLSRVQPELDGRDVKLVAVLDAAAEALPRGLEGDGAAEGGVRKTLGESYQALGMLDRAEAQFRAALELLRASLGENHEETIDAQGWLATTLADLGQVDEAVALLEQAYLVERAARGGDDPSALVMQLNLAALYRALDRLPEAEELARDNLAARRRVFGPADPRTANAMTVLGDVAWAGGRLGEAEALMREALDGARASQGERHPETLTRSCMLATLLLERGEQAAAEALYRASISTGLEVYGEDHFEVQAWMHNLAILLERAHQPSEAERLLRRVVASHERALELDHPDAAMALQSLVGLLARQGCRDEAREVLHAAVERRRAELGDAHPATIELARALEQLAAR